MQSTLLCLALWTCFAWNRVFSSCDEWRNPVVIKYPNVAVIVAGQDLDLSCTCYDEIDAKVVWLRDDKILRSNTRFHIEYNQLRILNVQYPDEGSYVCSVTLPNETLKSRSYQLQLYKPPTGAVVANQLVIKALVGQRHDLQCSQTRPDSKLVWEQDFSALNPPPNDLAINGRTLTILNASTSSTGLYICYEYIKTVLHSQSVFAFVVEHIQPPSVPGRVGSLLGETLVLQCLTDAEPFPVSRWLQAPSQPVTNTDRVKTKQTTLRISGVTKEDAGTFLCSVENSAGVRQRNVTLAVIGEDDISVYPPELSVVEGSSAMLDCQAPPNLLELYDVRWYFNTYKPTLNSSGDSQDVDRPVGDQHIWLKNSTLLLKDIVPANEGTYSCAASVRGSHVVSKRKSLLKVLTVPKASRNHVIHQKLNAREKLGKISCHLKGEPPTSIYAWSRKGQPQPLPERFSLQDSSLVIKELTVQDTGVYTCHARNKNGEGGALVNLTVYNFPVFTRPPSNTTATIGSPTLLHCQGEGYPAPRVEWRKENDANNSRTLNVLPNGTLIIPRVSEADEGGYFCILGNAGQIIQESVILTVIDGSSPAVAAGTGTYSRTIPIVVGCALAYIALAVALTVYCRRRRRRLGMKQGGSNDQDDDTKQRLVPKEEITMETMPAPFPELDPYNFERASLVNLVLLGRGKMNRMLTATVSAASGRGVTTKVVLVKELDRRHAESHNDFLREAEVLSQLQHKNIAMFIGVCKEEWPLYVITEYTEIGTVKDALLNLKASTARGIELTQIRKLDICCQIATGMEYMAANQFVHRDLAARNCLLFPDGTSKVAFLSLCADVDASDYYCLNGALVPLRWLSPEALNEDFSEKSDVWAFGMLIWEVFSDGCRPYPDLNDEKVLAAIRSHDRPVQCSECPVIAGRLMTQCWLVDPNQRPGFDELAADLTNVVV